MKEVTEWNGKPRWMWVWNDENKGNKIKAYVVHILSEEGMKEADTDYPVIATINTYKHCSETKEETHLTNYEFSQLLKCFGVEYCFHDGKLVYNHDCGYAYTHDKELVNNYRIRYKQGEWEEPTRETVWKWWEDETVSSDIADFVSFIGWDKE